MIELVTACSFVFIACLVWLLVRAATRMQHSPPDGRLPAPVEAGTAGAGKPTGGQSVSSAAAGLMHLPFDTGEVDRDLRRAGYYRPNARRIYLAVRNGLVVLAVLATGILAVVVGPSHQVAVVRILGLGLVATVVCLSLPRVILAIQARRRVERIRRGLPDALDMISMCLQGGLSLEDALAYVSREMFSVHPDLAVEFLVVRKQAEMSSLEFAFRQFVDRVDGPEIASLANLIKQNQILGTNVASSVLDYADSIRIRRRQTAEEQAGKVQLKVLFPIIFCLVPSVILILWGPAILELRNFLHGFQAPVIGG